VQLVIVTIVLEPLGAKNWRVEPIRKLLNVVGPSLRRHQFVVSDGKKYWSIAEGLDLLRNEITPFKSLVFSDCQVLVTIFGCGENVFVDIVGGAKITQVPVKLCLIVSHSQGDPWHDDVATVSGISGDSEGPRAA
jgi:hypothetical protein